MNQHQTKRKLHVQVYNKGAQVTFDNFNITDTMNVKQLVLAAQDLLQAADTIRRADYIERFKRADRTATAMIKAASV